VGKLLTTLVAVVSIFAIFGYSTAAIETSIPVELTVQDTALRVQGYASPGAQVTVLESNVTIGTTTAGANGSYSVLISAYSPGVHNIVVNHRDMEGVFAKSSFVSVSISAQQENVVNAVLSPTITRRTPATLQKGSVVQINGYTAANATVAMSFDVGGYQGTTQADSSGFYEFLVDSDSLSFGTYKASVVATTASLQTSEQSGSVQFEVVAAGGPTAPDIIVSPDQLPPPVPLSPENGASIDGDSVLITGESVPNAQINIYENGVLHGSIFADENGKWSFIFQATSSPVVLTFESCIDGRCSVLSKTLSLTFTGFATCATRFSLEQYRFWGVRAGEKVVLSGDRLSTDGYAVIRWGDGVEEKFNYSSGQEFSFAKAYSDKGSYNGTISFSTDETGNDCSLTRYFSVHVTESASNSQFWRLMWVVFFVAAMLLINFIATKDRQSGNN